MKFVLITLFLFTTGQCAPEFSERASNFNIDLLHYTEIETDGHVVISPFGVWSLMAGVALGTTGNSRAQLSRAFLLPNKPEMLVERYTQLTKTVLDPKSDGVTLKSQNFLFLYKGFNIRPDFQVSFTGDFGAMIQSLDFKDSDTAAMTANNLIQASGASVSDVLNSENFVNSRMILTNVITFKGLWSTPFNESETVIEPFYDENNNEIGKVNMMNLETEMAFSNILEMKSRFLELPYGDDKKYCMLVMLPHPKVKVSDVYKHLATVSFTSIFARLQSDVDTFGLEKINIKLPRFKISTNMVLNQPLSSMGVYDIFDPTLASFKQLTDEDIFVSAIVHKADIEVTESGTVASASTNADFSDKISEPQFHANSPFIYFVMEKPTTTVIFSGIYSKPSIY